MKKIICFIVTLALLTTSSAIAFAKPVKHREQENKNYTKEIEKKNDLKHTKVIKYGRYQLPTEPVIKGMGAVLTYDKETAVVTVTKDATTIVIDLKGKKVTVNGVEDTKSGIFTASKNKKKTVLIKYIAAKLGVRAKDDKDEEEKIEPKLDAPKNIKITPVGGIVVANTLNSTTQYMEVTADITPGQATGGRAELYVNTKLVATTSLSSVSGSAITFTTSDQTPTNDELRVAVPEGGAVTIKLYNAQNESVTSKSDVKLTVDYVSPTLTSVTSAIYMVSSGELYLSVAGAGAVKDSVNVTKLSMYDSTLARSYQLTDLEAKGSKGFVESDSSLKISLGEIDRAGLAGFGTSTVTLYIASGVLIRDAAGNTSSALTAPIALSVVVIK